MILIGAPSIVSGNETTEPTPLTALSPTSPCSMIFRYSLGENAAQLGPDGGELDEFVVIRGIGRLDVRQIDDRRAQRGSSAVSGLSPTRVTPPAIVLERNSARSSVESMM